MRKIKEQDRASKVVRVSKETLSKLEKWKDSSHNSWAKALDRLINESNQNASWTIPSAIANTQKEAKVMAMKIAIAQKKDMTEMEQPIKVRKLK